MKGQRFVNAYPQEITVLAKAVYLLLTTLLGARTLGEEYVDLIYVNRIGNRLPKLLPRLGFIVSYALVPYIISKIVKKLKNKSIDNNDSYVESNKVVERLIHAMNNIEDDLLAVL